MEKKKFYYKGVNWCLILMFLISFVCTPVLAVDSKEEKEVAKFEEMVDNYMTKALEEYHIPGVTLVAVKDGKILLKKGYGYADLENKIPVDPDKTLFRIGSVTKIFTATAVMQLVEQGKIDLNTDINEYLKDFKIESKYKHTITLADLLTHTAGFDESYNNVFLDKILDELKPFEDTIKNGMPPIIRQPGEVIQYSNHGYTLIGYIVEQVSGMSFDKYVEENILKPLNMNKSKYSLSSNILETVSKGYTYKNERFESQQLTSVAIHPAGSICSTSDDMAKFLIAHLQNGKYEDKRILQENTAEKMHTVQFTNHELLSGYCYGFYENMNNGKIVEHGGNTPYFSSLLSLCSEKNIGFFISSNSYGEDREIRDEFSEEFYKFFGVNNENTFIERIDVDLKGDLKKFEGDYVGVRRARNDKFKLFGLISKFKVRVNENEELNVKAIEPISGDYIRIEENLFKNKDNDKYIYFKEDKDGKQYMIIDFFAPAQAWEKLSIQESLSVSLLGPFVVLISLLGCIIWLINLFRKKKNKYTGMAAWARRISSITCLLILIFVVSVIMLVVSIVNFFMLFINLSGVLITICAVIMLILAVVLLILAVYVWKKSLMPIWSRIFYTLVTLAAIGCVVFMNFMNLLPWN